MSEDITNLWLEFEWWTRDEGSTDDDAFNMQVQLQNGTTYALNVWTFKALERFHRMDQTTGENLHGQYLIPPDLIVDRLDRQIVQEIITDLLRTKQMKDKWIVDGI